MKYSDSGSNSVGGPRTDGYIWWCEDEVCNCTEPRIEKIMPHPMFAGLIRDAEERWTLERELHKNQVRRIRKQRHKYIVTLQWLLAEARWFSEAGLSPVGMRRPWQ